jgi:hypothetical protein
MLQSSVCKQQPTKTFNPPATEGDLRTRIVNSLATASF